MNYEINLRCKNKANIRKPLSLGTYTLLITFIIALTMVIFYAGFFVYLQHLTEINNTLNEEIAMLRESSAHLDLLHDKRKLLDKMLFLEDKFNLGPPSLAALLTDIRRPTSENLWISEIHITGDRLLEIKGLAATMESAALYHRYIDKLEATIMAELTEIAFSGEAGYHYVIKASLHKGEKAYATVEEQ